ncbi:MAG: copper chaperone PCu(A)C [Anaerolineales bacterium]|nr:copper chaperone PCu(A)C [Anaerolineales bacterium]
MRRHAVLVHMMVLATGIFGCAPDDVDVHEHADDSSQAKAHSSEIVRHAGIAIADIWARPGVKDGNTAIYMEFTNVGDDSEYLVGVGSEICKAVEIHQVRMQGDIMTMLPVSGDIELLSGETVSFVPGDLHVMMIGLDADLAPKSHFEIELMFRISGPVVVDVMVSES